jgi:uroporphyrinogen decarboxylase
MSAASAPAPARAPAIANDTLLRALRREPVPHVPVWLMRQAGRYLPEYRALRAQAPSFLEFCYTPELAVEATLQPVRRFGLDAAILFSDILVIPDAMGQAVEFREGEGPRLAPLRSADDMARLDMWNTRKRLHPVYDAIERVKKALPDGVALIGFAGAPWTLAAYMIEGGASRDFRHAKGWALRAPDEFDRLLAMLESAVTQHLLTQIEAGAEAVQIFDSWAGVVPDGLFDRLCAAPLNRIAARLKAERPEVPIIAFPRGAGLNYRRIAGLGAVDAVSIDYAVPCDWARDTLQPLVTVQGNLDPIALVEGGAALEREASRILDLLGNGSFVFNLGHGVILETPPDHVAALVALVRGWKG